METKRSGAARKSFCFFFLRKRATEADDVLFRCCRQASIRKRNRYKSNGRGKKIEKVQETRVECDPPSTARYDTFLLEVGVSNSLFIGYSCIVSWNAQVYGYQRGGCMFTQSEARLRVQSVPLAFSLSHPNILLLLLTRSSVGVRQRGKCIGGGDDADASTHVRRLQPVAAWGRYVYDMESSASRERSATLWTAAHCVQLCVQQRSFVICSRTLDHHATGFAGEWRQARHDDLRRSRCWFHGSGSCACVPCPENP